MRRGQNNIPGHILTIAAFMAVALGFVIYILGQAGTIPTLGDKYTVTAQVGSANLLTPGARVTIAGAEVGSLKKVERDGSVSPYAKLTIELTDKRVFPLPRDSRVQIRTRSQVGENYVGITVGRDNLTIPDGGSIGVENADELVNVDQVLSTLQGRTRDRAREMFQSLGEGLNGRGKELNQTLSSAVPFVATGQQLTETLQRDKLQAAQLVDQLGGIMAAVGSRQTALTRLADRGVAAVQAVASQDDNLRSVLRELPPTLEQVRETSDTIGSVSDQAAPVFNALASATRAIRPSVQLLKPIAAQAIPLAENLGAARPFLDRVINTVIRIGDNVSPAVLPLQHLICQVNPTLRYLNPRLDDTLTIVSHLSSSSNAYDSIGHTIRLAPVEGEGYAAGLPPEVLSAEHTLLQSGLLFPSKVTNYNPYPAIGAVGKDSALGSGGEPSNKVALRKSGFKYPRVTADC